MSWYSKKLGQDYQGRDLSKDPRCSVCKRGMHAGQYGTHFACDPSSPVGKSCECPNGCSDKHYGDGKVPCARECVPCRAFKGQPLKRVKDKVK